MYLSPLEDKLEAKEKILKANNLLKRFTIMYEYSRQPVKFTKITSIYCIHICEYVYIL